MYLLKRFLGNEYGRINHIIDSFNTYQNEYINLEACCSYPFESVLEAQKFPMYLLPTEGVTGSRYFPAFQSIDDIDIYTEELLLHMLGLDSDDFGVSNQPHSGTQANHIVYNAILSDGDIVLSLDARDGGHISHNKICVPQTHVVNFGLTIRNEIDYGQIEQLAIKYHPKLVVVGTSSYPDEIDYKRIAEIAHRNGAVLLVDICHTVLYVMGGVYTNPLPYADFTTFTMDKTLRGPQGGMLVYKRKYKKEIDYSIFPLTQGGPLQSIQMAKLVALFELSQIDITEYAKAVQHNTALLNAELNKQGIRTLNRDNKTHIILLDVSPFSLNGLDAESLFYQNHILINKNLIPGDRNPPQRPSGIRLGTTCITNLEYSNTEIAVLGKLISEILLHGYCDEVSRSQLVCAHQRGLSTSSLETGTK